MSRILVTARSLQAHRDADYIEFVQTAGHEVVFADVSDSYLDEAGLRVQLTGIAGVMASSEPYTDAIFDEFPELRVVARLGVGYDAVDLEAAAEHGVPVMIAAGSNDTTVAESAVGLMLTLARDLRGHFQRTAAGDWTRPSMTELRDKTIGIIGLGRIGRSLVERLAGFQVRFVVTEPFPDPAFVTLHDIELTEADNVFREADFLTLHAPLGAETRAVVDARRLGLMKPNAYVINTARGGLVDEDALFDALQAGRIAGAALDVRTEEPPRDPRLAQLPNVLLTPHMAGVSRESLVRMSNVSAKNVVDVFNGSWDRNMVVNGVFSE